MARSKKSGISRTLRDYSINLPLGRPSTSYEPTGSRTAVSRLLGPQAIARERDQTANRLRDILQGLSAEDRAVLADIQGQDESEDVTMTDSSGPLVEVAHDEQDSDDGEWEAEVEGLPKKAKDELSMMYHAFRDRRRRWMGRQYKRTSSWKKRRYEEMKQWDTLIPALTDAYLRWKYPSDDLTYGSGPSAGAHPEPTGPIQPPLPVPAVPTVAEQVSLPAREQPPLCAHLDGMSGSPSERAPGKPEPCQSTEPSSTGASEPYHDYRVEVYDIFTLEREAVVQRPPESVSPAIDLVAAGYLPKTPLRPTVAISIRTMELFYRLRQRKASFSVEAFAKVICDYYSIPFRKHMRTVVADAFEIYARILLAVRRRVSAALGRDGNNWRVQNACAACCFTLEDEPDLGLARLFAMDGNNSLKRLATIASRTAADTRTFDESDYILSNTYVNQFADEVPPRKGPQIPSTLDTTTDDDGSDEEDEELGGDPTDGADSVDAKHCTENFKAAAAQNKKGMWGIFDESGGFVSACRHGLILWFIDMVRSGEQAKYPLATIAKALEAMPRTRWMCGYDIGCVFADTAQRSSLGDELKASGARFCVNAFHAYAHNFKCQLKNHPNGIPNMGLEDLETMERLFSASNTLASVIRYASPYRRRLLIHLFLLQWDEDKYANIGTFLYNNIVQALDIVTKDGAAVDEAMKSLGLTDEQLDAFEKEQKEYFATLGEDMPWDPLAITYVELLQELRAAEKERSQTTSQFLNAIPSDYAFAPPTTASNAQDYAAQTSTTQKVETARRHARERYERVLREVEAMEQRMGLGSRWTPENPNYLETLKYMDEAKYRKVLDNLRKLVVLRLFELHKMNLSQTGYRMRTHIAKSLQKRSKAIQRAVAAYNKAAAALDPPRSPVDWTRISHYTFLEEFNILQDTRDNAHEMPWARPEVRALMKLRQRVFRAREELARCNVEVRRVHTSVLDEDEDFAEVLKRLRECNDPIYHAVKEYTTYRRRVNRHLLRRVAQIHALAGFSGSREPGVRIGKCPRSREAQAASSESIGRDLPAEDEESEDDGGISDDEEAQGDIGGLSQYMSQL